MLYLVTGSNGTGKTLNTLKWVRELQLQNQERPVYYNGRFKLKPEKEAEFGWAKADFKDWQSLPDGSIVLVDEAHNDLPVRPAGQRPPDHIAALAEHRSRGFDFFLISQHPSNVDSFVRRLVGAPGWHRHLKRPFGRDAVTCLEFDAVNLQAEKPGAGKQATVKRISFPKEVYGWYDSAVMHTGKKTIPKQVWILLAGLILIPVLIWFAADKLLSKGKSADVKEKTTASQAEPSGQGLRLAKQDWLASHVPRVPGLVHTAPRYDKITEPVRAPIPAACLESASQGCRCYTQQGNLLSGTPVDLCRQIVRQGYFVDFDPEPEERRDTARERAADNDPHPTDDQGSFELSRRPNERVSLSMADVAAAYRPASTARIEPALRP